MEEVRDLFQDFKNNFPGLDDNRVMDAVLAHINKS